MIELSSAVNQIFVSHPRPMLKHRQTSAANKPDFGIQTLVTGDFCRLPTQVHNSESGVREICSKTMGKRIADSGSVESISNNTPVALQDFGEVKQGLTAFSIVAGFWVQITIACHSNERQTADR